MEIEAAVGNGSESRYRSMQIGAAVTTLGGAWPRWWSTVSR